MPNQLESIESKALYADTLTRLSNLSRTMLLAFRLEVGGLILQEFFDGSAHAYRDQNSQKVASFNAFARVCQDDLADLGLSAASLRQSILARIAWDGLPQSVREGLKFNHVATLARVDEPTLRARLAMDATREGWSVQQLRDAVTRAEDGRYYDTDPDLPGTQPPPAKPEADKAPQPGRLVNQLVKAGQELQTWRAAWATVDASKLRRPQRQRMLAALDDLQAQVERMRAELGGGGE